MRVSVTRQITFPPWVSFVCMTKGLDSTAQILRGSSVTEPKSTTAGLLSIRAAEAEVSSTAARATTSRGSRSRFKRQEVGEAAPTAPLQAAPPAPASPPGLALPSPVSARKRRRGLPEGSGKPLPEGGRGSGEGTVDLRLQRGKETAKPQRAAVAQRPHRRPRRRAARVH